MKHTIALLLTASLMLSGCSAISSPGGNTSTSDTIIAEPSQFAGTDSSAPAPEIGPEGLPTPTL